MEGARNQSLLFIFFLAHRWRVYKLRRGRVRPRRNVKQYLPVSIPFFDIRTELGGGGQEGDQEGDLIPKLCGRKNHSALVPDLSLLSIAHL